MMSGVEKALQTALHPVRDELFNGLIAKLDTPSSIEDAVNENIKAAKTTQGLADRLDKALCLSCGPNKFRLRQMRARLKVARSTP